MSSAIASSELSDFEYSESQQGFIDPTVGELMGAIWSSSQDLANQRVYPAILQALLLACQMPYAAMGLLWKSHNKPGVSADVQAEAQQLLAANCGWIAGLVQQGHYTKALDRSALQPGPKSIVPTDHLFSALLQHGLVQDCEVLLATGAIQPPAQGHQPPAQTSQPQSEMWPQSPRLMSIFHLGKDVCGHAGIVHGGLTSAMIDETLGYLLYTARSTSALTFEAVVTAKLEVNYKQPLLPTKPVAVSAWVTKVEGRKLWVEAYVCDGPATGMPGAMPGRVYATATALFIIPRMDGASHATLMSTGKGQQQIQPELEGTPVDV